MTETIITKGKFNHFERGEGEVMLLLHGLMGALSNFEHIIAHFSSSYRVVVPLLPIMESPLKQLSMETLVDYVEEFVNEYELKDIHLMGNSLGGHIGLLYLLRRQELIKSITLTGSSGLFENSMGSTFPRRQNYEFIKQKVQETFYDPAIATKEIVDMVFDMVNDRNKALRIVITAKSAIRHNLADKLHEIKVPALLVWGKNDTITPPFVGEEFHKLIPNSELVLLDKCGHAPMMEIPDEFNAAFGSFLSKLTKVDTTS